MKKKNYLNITSLTIQPGARSLTGDILLPSPLVDALFCKIEAYTGHGDQADPAKDLERDRERERPACGSRLAINVS
jgi:hypothetical protein